MPLQGTSFPFPELPLEVREQILGESFFHERPKPKISSRRHYTKYGKIKLLDIDGSPGRPLFETAIIRTCKQIQDEAERVLYGHSYWTFYVWMWEGQYDDVSIRGSLERFEAIPIGLRRLIQRVVVKCRVGGQEPSTNCEYLKLMTLLARKCSGLRSLTIQATSHKNPHSSIQNFDEGSCIYLEWCQDMLQIKERNYLDMFFSSWSRKTHPIFDHGFVIGLRVNLVLRNMSSVAISSTRLDAPESSFAFLALPSNIRDRVYRHTIIPPNGIIHPCLGPYFDDTTRNIIPLFLTSRQVYREAEALLCKEAVFKSLHSHYDTALMKHVQSMYWRQLEQHAPPLRFAVAFVRSDGALKKWKGKRKREIKQSDPLATE